MKVHDIWDYVLKKAVWQKRFENGEITPRQFKTINKLIDNIAVKEDIYDPDDPFFDTAPDEEIEDQ